MNSKKPLAIGSAILALGAAAWLKLSGDPEPVQAVGETRAQVVRVLADAGTQQRFADMRRTFSAHLPEGAQEDVSALVAGVQRGDKQALMDLQDKIGKAMESSTENATEQERRRVALEQFGIDPDEYVAASNGDEARRLLRKLQRSLEEDIKTDSYEKGRNAQIVEMERRLFGMLSSQAETGHPFHPLFLKWLGMDQSTLQDKLQEILVMAQSQQPPGGGLSPLSGMTSEEWIELQASVKKAYALPSSN